MNLDALMYYRDKKVHVVGFSGAEGSAVLSFLAKKKFSHLTAHDAASEENLKTSFDRTHVHLSKREKENAFQKLVNIPAVFHLGSDYLKNIETADLIFVGQNWFAVPSNKPVKKAAERGIPLKSLIQLYFGMSPAPIIAVTGTNGKTTVSHWIYHLLKTAGKPALISGNDRYSPQVLDRLETFSPEGYFVIEVSNRQLMILDKGPAIGVLTNIQPDHLDEHGSFEQYVQVKKRLFSMQSTKDDAVVNLDDPSGRQWIPRLPAHVLPYTLTSPVENGIGIISGDVVKKHRGKKIKLFSVNDVKIPGKHNLANALATAGAALCTGLTPIQIQNGIKTFTGVRNRIQWMGTINGISYFSDLASTNPAATKAALEAFSKPVIWIAGGDVKGNEEEYDSLIETMKRNVKYLIVLDSFVGKLLQNKAKEHVPYRMVSSLPEAMHVVETVARDSDIVLLSPSGAGFFSRFVVGSGFRKHLRNLKKQQGGSGNDKKR